MELDYPGNERMSVAPAVFKRASYPLRNQVAWEACERLFLNDIVLLGQANNISTPKMADLRYRLRQSNLFLRFPKPGVLRAFLRQSPWSSLEQAVVGPTFCAVSRAEPGQLREALKILQMERNIFMLGGKVLETQFTIEGVEEVITQIPGLEVLRAELVGLLQSPGSGVVQALSSTPSVLAATLQTHVDTMDKE